MNKLISEQLPNDGGWYIDRLVQEANERLGQIGKRGKRAKIVAKKSSLSLQFTFTDEQGKKQRNVGLGAIPLSAKGIEEAEKIAQLVTGQLVASTFTWDWFNGLIGKDTSKQSKVLTCQEMVEVYKKHYFKQKENNKSARGSWYNSYRQIEQTIGDLNQPLSLVLIRKIVDSTDNNTVSRKQLLNGLANFLKFFDNDDYKSTIKGYKAGNSPNSKPRNVPTDKRIAEVYQTGFTPEARTNSRYLYRLPRWQFLYGLLATYGLRMHEAWHIANWDKPVILKNGDWVIVADSEDSGIEQQYQSQDVIIPAMLDPENKDHILCVKHDTKTGYRMAMPISPKGCNWIEDFKLLQPLNLPDIPNPLKKIGKNECMHNCSKQTSNWFRRREYGFHPHDLRHAYVIRGHVLNYNPKALADSAGHSITMSSSTYTKHMKVDTQYENLVNASSKKREKDSELELLKSEVETLTNENAILKNENEILRAKLQIESLLAKQ